MREITNAWFDEAHILDAVLSAAESEKLNRAFGHLMDDGAVGVVVDIGDAMALMSALEIGKRYEDKSIILVVPKESYQLALEAAPSDVKVVACGGMPSAPIEITNVSGDMTAESMIHHSRRNKSDRKRNRQNRWR